MRRMLFAVCLFGLSMVGGCGLVFVPTVHAYPGVIKAIAVVDDDDGKVLPGADVQLEVVKYENWVAFPPLLVNEDEDMPGVTSMRKDDDRLHLSVKRTDDLFRFEQKNLWGSMQIWCPLPSVLGPVILHEHQTLIIASADKYHGLVFSYNPICAPVPGLRYEAHGSYQGNAQLDENGVLTFRLRRVNQAVP